MGGVQKTLFHEKSYIAVLPIDQHNYLAIGVPGLALECAKEIAALRGENLSVVLEVIKRNVRDL